MTNEHIHIYFAGVEGSYWTHSSERKKHWETVAFAVDERASLTDVRRRSNGIVRNAKAYKVPQKVLGSVLCNLIEHGKYVPVIALPVCQRSILKPTCYWFQ